MEAILVAQVRGAKSVEHPRCKHVIFFFVSCFNLYVCKCQGYIGFAIVPSLVRVMGSYTKNVPKVQRANPFNPKNDISPEASPEILHHAAERSDYTKTKWRRTPIWKGQGMLLVGNFVFTPKMY